MKEGQTNVAWLQSNLQFWCRVPSAAQAFVYLALLLSEQQGSVDAALA